jgi:pimeloyl-ACP methyl ester carboxylesterase
VQSELVPVTGGVHLHAHRWDGTARPYVLVHGLASNARLWHGVAARLAAAGHLVVAVDQRGHGRSEKPGDGYTIATCAADLALLVEGLGLQRPVVAGQSWGGNVVLQLAADRPGSVHGVALVDGGWIRLQDTFADWDDCGRQLRPPALAGLALSRLEAAVRVAHPSWPDEGVDATLANFELLDDGTIRPWLTLDRHRAILRDLWEHDPRALYARVTAPVLLVPADHGGDGAGMVAKRRAVDDALEVLPDARVHWFGPPADHDLHAQHPDELATLLLELGR